MLLQTLCQQISSVDEHTSCAPLRRCFQRTMGEGMSIFFSKPNASRSPEEFSRSYFREFFEAKTGDASCDN